MNNSSRDKYIETLYEFRGKMIQALESLTKSDDQLFEMIKEFRNKFEDFEQNVDSRLSILESEVEIIGERHKSRLQYGYIILAGIIGFISSITTLILRSIL